MRSVLSIFIVFCIFSVTSIAKAQLFGKNWATGCYYDLLGHKNSGLIAWSAPGKYTNDDHIAFKPSSDAKQIKIESYDLIAFVMKTDSFVVSKLDDISDAPFLQVVVNNNLKLYLSARSYSSYGGTGVMMIGYGGLSKTYYYGTDPDNIKKLERKNFIEIMCQIMADKPDVVSKIKDKTFKYGSMDALIIYYKTGKMPQRDYDY